MTSRRPASRNHERLLATLVQLLEVDATDLRSALTGAAQRIAEAFGADKVDAFIYDSADDALVARGVSDTCMGRRERELGLDRLLIAGGGRTVAVYQTGAAFHTGRADEDPAERADLVRGLGIRSALCTPLAVDGARRGVLLVVSAQPNFFCIQDLRFLETVGRWVGLVAHRAQLAGWLAAILEQLPQGVSVADADGHMVLVNSAARRLLGLLPHQGGTLAEFVETHQVREALTGKRLAVASIPVGRALLGEEVRQAEVFVRPSGADQDVWLLASAAPLLDSEGRVTGAAEVFTDVTIERRLARDLSATALENARLLGELFERQQRQQQIAERLFPVATGQQRAVDRAAAEALTPRERDVLDLLAQGLANDDIARRLHLTVGTVKVHVRHVLAKLGVTSRVQAALLAAALRLEAP